MEDRDYQIRVEQETYGAWDAGFRNNLVVLPTGAGKTHVFSNIVRDCSRFNMIQAVIAHRNELVSQMSLAIASKGVPHKIIANDKTVARITRRHRDKLGRSMINPSAQVAVIGVDTLMARQDQYAGWAKQVDQWVIDECFVSGTLITTDQGPKEIQDIKVGDRVFSFNENDGKFYTRQVRKLFKNPMPAEMVRVKTLSGTILLTTKGHPFWTKNGWVESYKLKTGDEVSHVKKLEPELHDVWDTDRYTRGESQVHIQENGQGVLFPEMCLGIQEPSLISHNEQNEPDSCFKENARKKSDEVRFNENESVRYTQENRTCADDQGRKWETSNKSGTSTRFSNSFLGVSKSVYCCHESEAYGLPSSLQDRCSECSNEDSNRDRRQFAQSSQAKRTRSEEDFISDWDGLESVEIYQPGSTGEHGDGFVYNIEVDEFHTYIANNIVVHNCHHTVGNYMTDQYGNPIRDEKGNLVWTTEPNKWGKAVGMFCNARGLGVTATPIRADGQGLGRKWDGVFDHMIIGPTMRQLIDRNYLADYEVVCPTSDLDTSESPLSADGDWSPQTLRKAAKKSHIVGDTVSNYIKYAHGRSAIVFATDVETAVEMAQRFRDRGIRAEAVHSKTDEVVRDKHLTDFAQKRIDVLINVDLFDEGFDCPSCDVIIMARPTASLGKYLQMVGRALRYMQGKIALIIDQVSNILRHGLPDKDRFWSLARREKKSKGPDPEELKLRVCRSCTRPHEPYLVSCPYCGAEKPSPAPRERTIQTVEGDLILLDRETLAKLRAATTPESPADVAARVAHVTQNPIAAKGAAKRQLEKIEAHERLKTAIAQWAAIQRLKGLDDRAIQRLFYITLGIDVLSALDASKTRADMDLLSQTIEGWVKK